MGPLTVLCSFISLFLIVDGIMYISAGSVISVIVSVLFDGESISFDASLVMYINKNNIPPTMIMNRIYENQSLLYIIPLISHIMCIVVWISSVSPMASGCFICVNVIPVNVLTTT